MNDLILLRHEDWLRCFPFFSADAVVKTLDPDTSALPMHLDDVPVKSYAWPKPVSLYRVGIYEPERSAFDAALLEADIELPEVLGLPGADLIPDEDVSAWPGSITPNLCPNCKADRLRISDVNTALEHVRIYNRELEGVMRWEACESHGIHIYVNGKLIVLLECITCCEHYLLGEGTGNKMIQIRLEA